MITIPDLQTALLDLLREVKGTDVKLIIGGGFGIYLKTVHVRRLGVRTLLKEWPEPRSTNDIDLFLRPELLIEPAQSNYHHQRWWLDYFSPERYPSFESAI